VIGCACLCVYFNFGPPPEWWIFSGVTWAIKPDRQENVREKDGHLQIEARRDNHGIAGTVREYSSGRVRSKQRGDWTYGKFEIRAKLPAGQGVWPAIWMLPTTEKYGTWAASGEIDIMEFKGHEFHMVLNLAVGGGFVANPDASTKFPCELLIDFVRVYQR